ncbi:MAG: dicarboxylate/amino acid:cation symporter [Gemmatimonadales bacterium]|nr:dicarboxylate/amino acid:cation symporter [Gemmatimonadales bacterium]MDZ4388737.1 dicarboxylate/amino acid:cation symporter [Gemmatimonadales bacterium]
MSLTTRVLLALLLGMIVGIALTTIAPAEWRVLAAWLEPVGTLWTRALQMTVLPLVVTLLFTGVLTGGSGIGSLGLRGVVLFVVLLAIVAAVTVAVVPALFAKVTIDPVAAAALREGTSISTPDMPSLRDWVVGLMPNNLVAASGTGAMLPIIVATLLFGAAASHLPEQHRSALEVGASAIAAMTLVVVRWVLGLAPIGVFALAVPLTVRLGVSALSAVGAYIGITAGLSLITIIALYPLVLARGVSLRNFLQAAGPGQSIAMSSRSSLAALPAMIEGATSLGLSDRVVGFFLPFSSSLFRLGAAIAIPVGVSFVALLYGVALGPSELLTLALMAVLLSFSVPGIPGGSILIMAPVLIAVGVPVEGVGILLGVDTIPDMFRTTTNVTGTMVAATLVEKS